MWPQQQATSFMHRVKWCTGRRLARAEAVVMDEKKNLLAKGYASLAIIVRKQGSQEK